MKSCNFCGHYKLPVVFISNIVLCFPHYKVSRLRERLSLITFLSSSDMESNLFLPLREMSGEHINGVLLDL